MLYFLIQLLEKK